jgi:hypothetical protein
MAGSPGRQQNQPGLDLLGLLALLWSGFFAARALAHGH